MLREQDRDGEEALMNSSACQCEFGECLVSGFCERFLVIRPIGDGIFQSQDFAWGQNKSLFFVCLFVFLVKKNSGSILLGSKVNMTSDL